MTFYLQTETKGNVLLRSDFMPTIHHFSNDIRIYHEQPLIVAFFLSIYYKVTYCKSLWLNWTIITLCLVGSSYA